MKFSAALYLVIGVLGLAAALLVPTVIYRGGSNALPAWSAAASPGPLSSAHSFIGANCEACHTPNQGIKAVSCITCHAYAPELLAKQSTAFHAHIGDCRGCHIEHQGGVRPITMDHSVLTRVGLRTIQADAVADWAMHADGFEVAQSLATASGAGPATDARALNCATCHSFADPHLGYFGQDCAACHTALRWKIAGYLHPSPRSQDCNQCHKAPPSHYMMHFNMVDRGVTGQRNARVEQCYLCHQTDSFNDIRGVGWYKMH